MSNNQSAIHDLQRGPDRKRGVTFAHYHQLRRLVAAGKTTWKELEEKGIILPSARDGEFRKAVERELGIE